MLMSLLKLKSNIIYRQISSLSQAVWKPHVIENQELPQSALQKELRSIKDHLKCLSVTSTCLSHGGLEMNAFDCRVFFVSTQIASSKEKPKRWVDFFVI